MTTNYEPTAFSQLFAERNLSLSTSENPESQAYLYLSFWGEELKMNLGVYDPQAELTDRISKSTEIADVEAFLETVSSDYAVPIPSEYRASAEMFLRLAPEGLALSVELQEPVDCEYCGPSGSSLEAFYFPSPGDGIPASLSVSYEYGCTGYEAAMGDPKLMGAEAVAILETALSSVDEGQDKVLTESFLSSLEGLL